MKAATGEYINLYSEVGCYDDTDLESHKLDIYILFCEADFGRVNMIEMEERVREIIRIWKDKYYESKEIKSSIDKLNNLLKREFDEAVLVVVNII